MRPPSLSLSSVAAAFFFRSPVAMYSRPHYRGRGRGRGEGSDQFRRGYSDSPLVNGDYRFQSVRGANLGLQPPNYAQINNNGFYPYCGNSYAQRPNPQYNCNPSPNFGFRPHSASNERPFQQPPMRPKRDDYRRWDAAKDPPPPTLERFSVLSYNILADYLANKHQNQLYYHIPHRFMDWRWRRKSIHFELGLWSPDIMCFQEVDRFRDLEEDLRNQGYVGIWKMRTGVPVDGCATFWRTSRFKLVHEEHIEFNKLGMRDNVAQICVLESMIQNHDGDLSDSSKSTEGPNKVVICNIHVLFNPRRGEMKLGQVRVLLDKAQAASKNWNDAPIVLCGDYNCTPKSALYNFISNQKLDLSEVDRDKVSGQASAQIPPQTREFRSHSGVKSYSYTVPNSEHTSNVSATPLHLSNAQLNHSQNANFIKTHDTAHQATGSSFTENNQEDKSVAIEFDGSENFEGFSLNAEEIGEDSEKFLSDLHHGDGILEDSTHKMESVKYAYDPSRWTPMEVATATGNADCTILEHPLKLKSTYAEVEGSSETRDSNGEPVLTSYNTCFMGTVDYIWRSEGIKTLRVLAPLPKSAVQWTQGFPTKKWGSDHIALVSELAFTKKSA